jgi:ABC-type antimicrobial peptide transport system permease subunit
MARLALTFGAVALTLAAIGLYGVLSYGVARRTSEIAIRLALGAQRRDVMVLILREGTAVVIAGLLAGGGVAWMATRLIASRLHGIELQDPITLALAVGLLLAVALLACVLPARRASKLDPIQALHQT